MALEEGTSQEVEPAGLVSELGGKYENSKVKNMCICICIYIYLYVFVYGICKNIVFAIFI